METLNDIVETGKVYQVEGVKFISLTEDYVSKIDYLGNCGCFGNVDDEDLPCECIGERPDNPNDKLSYKIGSPSECELQIILNYSTDH